MNSTLKSTLKSTLACSLFALAVACASTPDAPRRAEVTQQVQVEAAVIAVDRATRELTLEGADGSRVVVVAGPEVRNFAQIEVGATVTATYLESLSARLLGEDEVGTDPTLTMAAGRAEAGAKPGAGVAEGVGLTVEVQSVDVDENLVVFTDPTGELHAIRPRRDEGKRFIAGLEPGDRVELIYGRAMALTVD